MWKGYKQTEIGMIPEEWNIASLKDLSDGQFTYGVNAPAIPYAPPLPNYIRITDISDDGRFICENRTSVDCQNPEMYTLKENDIVFARTGASTGKTYLYRKSDGDLVYAGFLIKASILPEKANSKYVFDNLHTNRYWDWVSVTSMRSGQPGINGNEYASYMIPCPSLLEQERIAEALSDVDSLISSLEKLIAKKKAVKQGAMQELLTGKKRLPGFDREWDDYTIGKMGEFYSGLSGKSKKDFDCGDAYYITFLNVLSNVKIDTSILASVDVRKNESQNSVRKGDLFFNTSSETPEEVGMCAVLDEELENTYLNSFCFGFRLFDNTHEPLFLSYYLNSSIGRKIMSVLAQGATRYNLSKNNFAETIIKLPTKEEQTAIASILSDMDNEIEVLEQKLEKTRQIKQGMMQQLLTGKIRLV